VNSFDLNPWGLYQVHGNVGEWTADCWGDYQGAPIDGSVSTSGDPHTRVFRGGSWDAFSGDLRLAKREWRTPDNRDKTLGFRIGRTLVDRLVSRSYLLESLSRHLGERGRADMPPARRGLRYAGL
jgi:formylglycine-generating enzyme required for sulfatase activity